MADLDALFTQMAERMNAHPERMEGLALTFEFNVEGEGGGAWNIRVDEGRAALRRGAAEGPDYSARLSTDDFVQLATGETSGQELFFSGRMKVEGNPFLGIQLSQLVAE